MAADRAAGLFVSPIVSHGLSRAVDERFRAAYSGLVSPVSHDTPSASHSGACGARPLGAPRARSDAPSTTTCWPVFDERVRHRISTCSVCGHASSH